MRILQVSNGFPPEAFAGVEQHTLQLCRALRPAHAVAVFCRTGNLRLPEFVLCENEYDGLPVWRVNNNFLDVLDFERFYLQPEIEAHFRTVVREWQPDLIHFQHCLGLSASLPRAARELGIPSLLTLHDYWYICPTVQLLNARQEICAGTHHAPNCFECVRMGSPRLARLRRSRLYPLARALPDPVKFAIADMIEPMLGWSRSERSAAKSKSASPQLSPPQPATEAQARAIAARAAYMREMLDCPARLTAPSQFVKSLYTEFGVPAEKIDVIPLGMEVARWREEDRPPAPAAGGRRFAYLGSLLPHKGVAVILQAFAQLTGPKHRLDLHGFNGLDRRFSKIVGQLVAADMRIAVHGAYTHDELAALLRQIDVLLVPSLCHETYSFVAREALLAGVWVLASDAGVFRELIRPGQNGDLIPPGDVRAWAEALRLAVEQWPLPNRPPELTFQPMTFSGYADTMEALYRTAHESSTIRR